MIVKIKKLFNHGLNLVKHSLRDSGISQKRSPHWAKIEKEFLSSNPTCACCGTNTRVQVHHVLPFHLYPELELDPNNLISMCMSQKECHLRIAHGSNFKKYVAEVREYAAILSKDISKFEEIEGSAKKNAKDN